MGGSGALDAATIGLVVTVLTVTWFAVEFILRSRQHARRPWLPYDDRPPAGLRRLRSQEISAEVESGMAHWIGYLRRRALRS
jgi:hypothetical protein